MEERLTIKKEWFVESKKSQIKDDYDFLKQLGAGAYGQVLLAKHRTTGKMRAVKCIHKHRVQDIECFKNEVRILSKLDSPHIIKVIEHYESDRICFLVMEYCQGGELFFYITKNKRLTESLAIQAMKQVVAAVMHCHKSGICHRDIKPENFLLKKAENGDSIKLIDFGLSREVNEQTIMTSLNGTAFYVAPEVIKRNYTYHCDNWSVGVLLYVMLTGSPPFGGKNNQEILYNIVNTSLRMDHPALQFVSNEAKDLITKLLERDISRRLTAEQAYNHDWFKQEYTQSSLQLELPLDLSQKIQEFAMMTQLKRGILIYIASKLVDEDIESLRAAFLSIDQNGDGTLSKEEIKNQLARLGKEVNEEDLGKLFLAFDTNNNGQIDYTEFIAACLNCQQFVPEIMIREAFTAMDTDNSGKISLEELKEFFKGSEEIEISQQQLDKIINEVDVDKDGSISYVEFLNMMRTQEKVIKFF